MLDPEILPAAAGQTPSRDARILAALGHALALTGVFTYGLGCLLGPLLMWAAYKDTLPFVGAHAKEALNFNLTFLLACAALLGVLMVTLGLGVLLVGPLAAIVVLAWLVLTVVAAAKAGQAEDYRYPFALRLIK